MPRRGRLLPETTEAFLDGHVSAFGFLGGVPQSILYDNTRLAVARILGDGRRKRTRAFTELQSHYLFEDRFGRPGKGNDKGKVEGMVGYVRRNFLVTVPSFESFDALNDYLKRRCLERMDARLRGHTETIGQRMERDLDALLPLPPVAYDACEKQAGRVSSLSLVRYRANDYSVPVAYGHRDVLVRGYVDQVVISCGTEIIARHPRSYERDDFVYDPIHYLPLLERKPGALDQAAPLQGWALPEEFGTLRRLLESRMGRRGKREFVQVLRLLETFSMEEVQAAIRDAIRLGSLSFDAVKHLVLCRLEGRPPRLDLELYPYLPRVRVGTTARVLLAPFQQDFVETSRLLGGLQPRPQDPRRSRQHDRVRARSYRPCIRLLAISTRAEGSHVHSAVIVISRASTGISLLECGSTASMASSRAMAPRRLCSPSSPKVTGMGNSFPSSRITALPRVRSTLLPSANSAV